MGILRLFFPCHELGGFHGSKYDSQSHVLDFVQPALVGLTAVPHVVDAYSMVSRTVGV